MKMQQPALMLAACEICRLQLLFFYLFLHFDTEARRRGRGSDGKNRQEKGILMREPVNSRSLSVLASAVSNMKSS